MSEETKNRDPLDRLDALLRQRPCAEPPPWFAARTMARLRNDLSTRPRFGFRLWSLSSLEIGLWTPRRLSAGLALLVVLVGLTGLHLKTAHDNKQLTFDALALAAQGEAPFTDEETTWPEGAF